MKILCDEWVGQRVWVESTTLEGWEARLDAVTPEGIKVFTKDGMLVAFPWGTVKKIALYT